MPTFLKTFQQHRPIIRTVPARFNDLLERPLELLSQLGRHSLSCPGATEWQRMVEYTESTYVSAFRLPRLSFSNEACLLMFCAWAPMLCALEDRTEKACKTRRVQSRVKSIQVHSSHSSPFNQIVSVRLVTPKHLAVLLAAWAAFPGAWEGWHPANPCPIWVGYVWMPVIYDGCEHQSHRQAAKPPSPFFARVKSGSFWCSR